MRYRAAFFDAGGTILGPHPSFHEAVARFLGENGVEVDPIKVEKALEEMPRLQDPGVTWSTSREASRRFWGSVYSSIIESLGIDDQSGRLAGALYEQFTRFESYRMFPDVVPAIDELKAAGLAVGLISNFEEWLEEMLTHWEVAALFDVIVVSGKEGVEKPSPEIFERALARANVAPTQAVYVGDYPVIDIEAAEAVGMSAILIDRQGRYPDYPGRRITTLTELLPILGLE